MFPVVAARQYVVYILPVLMMTSFSHIMTATWRVALAVTTPAPCWSNKSKFATYSPEAPRFIVVYVAANGAAGAKCDVYDDCVVVYRCEWQVVQSQLYGCTYEFVKHYLKEKLDVEVTFVDSANVDEFKAAIRPDTKVCIYIYSWISSSIHRWTMYTDRRSLQTRTAQRVWPPSALTACGNLKIVYKIERDVDYQHVGLWRT